MTIQNNTKVVSDDKKGIKDAKKGLKKHSVTYASTTDLTAKGESKDTMEQEESLITEYKKILERDLKNISALDEALQDVDTSYK